MYNISKVTTAIAIIIPIPWSVPIILYFETSKIQDYQKYNRVHSSKAKSRFFPPVSLVIYLLFVLHLEVIFFI